MRTKMDLNKKIDDFVSKYTNNAKQRSDEWYQLVQRTIGGSEISTVLGENKYKTKYDLAKEKVGLLPKFTGNAATRWGTIFEDIVARFIELDCGTVVKGGELTINEIDGIRYSPDGYVVIKVHKNPETKEITLVTRDLPCYTDDDSDDADQSCPYCEYAIALLEIKCPRTRKPVEGEIPEHYKPQLLSGLAHSPITDIALFTESVIKRSPLEKLKDKEGLAYGLVGIYAESQPKSLLDKGFIKTSVGGLLDLGKCLLKDLDECLDKTCNGVYKYDFTDLVLEDDPLNIDTLLNDLVSSCPEGRKLIAVLPYTINEIYYSFQERDTNYMDKILGPVKEFINMVDRLRSDPTYIDVITEEEKKLLEDDYSNLFSR